VATRLQLPPAAGRITVTAGALAILCVIVVMFASLPDQLILFPTTNRLDPRGAVRKIIPFESDELEVWTAKSRRAQQGGRADIFILRFYGNADRADRWVASEAEMWNDRAVEIWGMNYPGFGGSTGPARLSRIGPAALAAFDELKHYADDRPIVPFGASIGATAALHVAAQRPIAGLILHNPPPLREMILRQFGWWNLWLLAGPVALQIPRDLDSIENARAIRAPAIFLLAEKDEVVAPRFHRLVVDAYAGEKRVILLRGAYHNDPIEGGPLVDLNRAINWLLAKPSSSRALE
jgi:pimeloyl-ACP methyl ester carboxylesterase